MNMNTTTTTPAATQIPNANIVQLTQGSPEWHADRHSRRNASESAAVLGRSAWMTPYQLWLLKTGRAETKISQVMQRGTDMEPLARAAYEAQTGLVMQPLVLEAGDYSASLDGMTLKDNLVLEIKCPLRGTFRPLDGRSGWTSAGTLRHSGTAPAHDRWRRSGPSVGI